MLPFAFVLLGKNFYEPMGLTLSDTPIQKCGIVSDDKFLAAIVTAKSAHLCKAGRTLPRLTFLYGYGSHRYYILSGQSLEAAIISMSAMGDITSTENLVHADLLKHDQPEAQPVCTIPLHLNGIAGWRINGEHCKILGVARRPDKREAEILSKENLEELRHNLAHLSLPAVRNFYEQAYQDCRLIYDRLPAPRQIQTLVQVWKQLWRRR